MLPSLWIIHYCLSQCVAPSVGCAKLPARPPAPTCHPSPGSLLCDGFLVCSLSLLPALWQGTIVFISSGPFPSSLCMGVAAHSLQQYWIATPWVKLRDYQQRKCFENEISFCAEQALLGADCVGDIGWDRITASGKGNAVVFKASQ